MRLKPSICISLITKRPVAAKEAGDRKTLSATATTE